MTHTPPITRILAGVLDDAHVTHDNVDVLLHLDVKTRTGPHGETVELYRITVAIPADAVPDLAAGLDEEGEQLRAGPSAIDDHDRVVSARLDDLADLDGAEVA